MILINIIPLDSTLLTIDIISLKDILAASRETINWRELDIETGTFGTY